MLLKNGINEAALVTTLNVSKRISGGRTLQKRNSDVRTPWC